MTALSEDETAVGETTPFEFTIFFYTKQCKHTKVNKVKPLEEMRIAMDDDKPVAQPIPALSDVEGLLTSAKCDGLRYEVTLNGKKVEFFYIKEGHIYLSPPAL